MNLKRSVTAMLGLVCVVALTATGQQDNAAQQAETKSQLERCNALMPTILKNYNNAKYAVFLSRQTALGGQVSGMQLDAAQAGLDAMEAPLKICAAAVQSQAQPLPDKKGN